MEKVTETESEQGKKNPWYNKQRWSYVQTHENKVRAKIKH